MRAQKNAARRAATTFRTPEKGDGMRVHALVGASPPLDENSLYCNILQCTHFASTSMLAERDGDIVGWVSGYRPPEDQTTLFVWQVAVSDAARGEGMGGAVIDALLAAPGAKGVERIRTTITPSNAASWALFRRVARSLDTQLHDEAWLYCDREFGGLHESERLVTIGPFTPR